MIRASVRYYSVVLVDSGYGHRLSSMVMAVCMAGGAAHACVSLKVVTLRMLQACFRQY